MPTWPGTPVSPQEIWPGAPPLDLQGMPTTQPAPPLWGIQPTGEHYPTEPNPVSDYVMSMGTGLMRGMNDLKNLPSTIAQWLVRPFADEGDREVMRQANEMDRQELEENLHQPETEIGQSLANIASFVPGAAILGPAGGWSNVARYGLFPGALSEAGGRIFEDTALEPYARVAGALLGVGGMAIQQGAGSSAGARLGANVGPAMNVIARHLKGLNLSQAEITAAEQMIARGQTQGINLTWPEALSQATSGRVDMAALQRVVEQSRSGVVPMNSYLSNRPMASQSAFRSTMDQTGLTPDIPPGQLGVLMQDLARNELQAVRNQINAGTASLYNQAGQQSIDPAALAQLQQSPIFVEALRRVRNDPVYRESIGNLPDENILVLDAVKRFLDDQASMSGGQLMTFAQSAYANTSDTVRRAATNASPDYADALTTQAYQRQNWLTPLQEGPLGTIAGTADLGRQIAGTFQRNPLAGSAPEVAGAVSALRYANPEAVRNFVGQHLQQVFDQATRAGSSGANQFGQAGFVAAVKGNSAQSATLEAAVRALPYGDDVWQGLNNLLELFEATGRRATAGSPTAFNQSVIEELSAGTPIGNIVADLGSPAELLSKVRMWYNDLRTGANTEALAKIITNPNNAHLFRMLADKTAFDDLLAVGGVLLSQGSTQQRLNAEPAPPLLPMAPMTFR